MTSKIVGIAAICLFAFAPAACSDESTAQVESEDALLRRGRHRADAGAAQVDAAPSGEDAGQAARDAGTMDGNAGPPTSGSGGTPGARSGLAWMSGSDGDPSMTPKYFDAFGTWRGRSSDVALMYTDRSSWANLTGNTWVFGNMAGWGGTLIISQPLFPDDGSNLADCAAGKYNAHWQDFGRSMVAANRADSIVRLGWEFNGEFMYWHATNDTNTFISCWNNAASSIKSTNPQALLDWTINGHGTPGTVCNGLATNCYPGDAFVDYVGIDNYDFYPNSKETPFDTIANAQEGLTWLYNFAVQHKKRFGVGEWGVVSAAGRDGGGDNAAFVQNMWNWFSTHAASGLYEAYFNNSDVGNVQSDLFNGDSLSCGCENPNASAQYRSLYKR